MQGKAVFRRCTMRSTTTGHGFVAMSGSKAVLDACHLSSSGVGGLVSRDAGTLVTASGCILADNDMSDFMVQDGSCMALMGCHAFSTGVIPSACAQHPGTKLTTRNCVFRGDVYTRMGATHSGTDVAHVVDE